MKGEVRGFDSRRTSLFPPGGLSMKRHRLRLLCVFRPWRFPWWSEKNEGGVT